MEREISSSVSLAVSMSALAALLGIVFFTVMIGNGVKEDLGTSLNKVQQDISVNYIKDLANREIDNEMPASTAYNILTMYNNVVIESACGRTGVVTNLMTQEPCLKGNLVGRVSLELVPVNGGAYIAFVHDGSSNWIKGNDTDPYKSIYATLRAKYGL
jgi:hypothetical protein